MIAVAIIGILAAIALPSYRAQVPKAQLQQVLVAMQGQRVQLEQQLLTGGHEFDTDEFDWPGSPYTTGRPEYVFNADGTGRVRVRIGGRASPDVTGAVMSLTRNGSGEWQCEVDGTEAGNWDRDFLPLACSEQELLLEGAPRKCKELGKACGSSGGGDTTTGM